MRKWFLCRVVIGLMLCVGPSRVHAISLDFSPTAQDVPVGDPVSVALRISGLADLAAPSLGSLDLDVNFNPTVLSFLNVSYGDPVLGDQLDLSGFGSITFTTAGLGFTELFELSFDSASVLNAGQTGDFDLATLTFTSLASGTSSFALSNVILGDALGNPLSANLGTAGVNVTSRSAVPEPATLILLITGLAGMAGARLLSRRG